MRRLLPLLPLMIVLLSAFAWAAGPNVIFQKFDHTKHRKVFDQTEISCVACHQFVLAKSGSTQAELAEIWQVPRASCHQCHAPGEGGLGGGDGVPRAPRACASCHDEIKQPDSHVAGWVLHHGADAAASGATCQDCHSRSACVDCHDRRENASFKAHDPSWLTVHGIVARAGPAGCDNCHVQNECTSCHSSAAGYGRKP